MSSSAQPIGPPLGSGPDQATYDDGGTVFLSVKLNGNIDSDLAQFTERDGQLYLSRESARQLQFTSEFLDSVSDDTPLSRYPEVEYNYERNLQRISIRAPFSILALDTTRIGGQQSAPAIGSASPGMLLNYDLYSSYTNTDDISLSGFTELRGFTDWGVLSTSQLFQGSRATPERQWDRSTVRINTVLEHSLQDQQITFRLGDTLTNGLSWSRRTRIGGVQISRNFSLQPYQTTAPLPAYFGAAALPSAVELYVNGIQQYTGEVPAGPFELNAMPSVSGAGQARVVMTDALGRRTSINFPYYHSSRLLRQGLSDWSFEAGYVRGNYGYRSFDYESDPMVSATLRHGFSNILTGEGHLEGSRGIVSGGVGAIMNIGMAGTVSGSWAQSIADGLQGKQYALGYDVHSGPLGLGVNVQRGDHGFRDVASQYGGAPVIRSDSAYVGVDTGPLGNFALNYAHLQQAEQPRYRYGGASWSRNFEHGITLSLSANQNLDDRRDRSVYLNLSFNLNKGLSAYGSATQSRGATTYSAGLQRSARSPDEWSWGVQTQHAEAQTSASAEAGRHTQSLDFNLGVNSAGKSQNVYAGATGALIAMDGGVFASRRIQDGFAVVSTSGIQGIPVSSHNQPIGLTDRHGRLLVPVLQAYQHNRISIDPTGLPVDMRIKRVRMDAVPRHASGVKVNFQIERVHAASLVLHTADGQDVPMGAQVFLNDSSTPTGWVGYDGRLYVEGLAAENQLRVQGEGLDCGLRFAYQPRTDTLPEIGPLSCE